MAGSVKTNINTQDKSGIEKKPKHRYGLKGLTLVELVISTAILSVILIASFSLVLTGIKVYQANTKAVTGQSAVRNVLMQMTRDIRRMDSVGAFDQVLYDETGMPAFKTLDIGSDITYRLDCGTKELTREMKETDLNGVVHVVGSQMIPGVNDIRVVMNELTRTDISIAIQSNSDMKTIETQITFRK
ncbi:MAG: hypothetical protein PHX37_01370 [Eubacteriales bacterium]|nr:hypothetical protein [Eubacteriales bacterium]